MNVRVKFLGASGEVTGSKYLLQIDDFTLLLDCGLFQGRKELRLLNWDKFPVDPESIDAVVITHAHLDHTGYLPKLFKDGYKGPVYCTTATADLMDLILMDSAGLQMEEARYAKKKGYSKHEDPQPLYTIEDVEPIKEHIVGTTFENPLQIAPRISVCFYNAGHILGAAIVELTLSGHEQTKKIVFSGDLGRPNDIILYPPHIMKEADILFVESTYGDRDITPTEREDVLDMMNDTFEHDGNIIVPAFSIGRTQTLLMMLKNLLHKKEIPKVRIFVDSPMAIKATEFYRKHKSYHKLEDTDIENDETFLELRNNLTVTRTAEESKKINDYKHDTVIIAGSGMMTGGRILHHLYHRLPHEENVIVITGYQAYGGRGWRLQRGEPTIRIYGQDVQVKAKVFTINGLSAHADRSELLDWLNGFEKAPKQTFVVHGEQESAESLRNALLDKGWNAHVPHYLENVELFHHI
ncbi:MAG: MBL fold metallo-hydrolase [Chitinophagaceae bacterium]|jgi:metallo-beta-lactamase family protein|nr:MBL fold metallo-hydrolase [Chitinophagaceae bacterium]